MDKIKVSKVEGVNVLHRGTATPGTLHLSLFHLVFVAASKGSKDPAIKTRPKESWIAYPIIWRCTFRPASAASGQSPSIRLQCRDFTFLQFNFQDNLVARDVFDSIRDLTCRLGRIEKLYAFKHKPLGPEKEVDNWSIYNPRAEWKRQGISEKSHDRGWRITGINSDYKFCPTYPSSLVVPTSISDNVINYAGKFRSRCRIPVLTYLHPVNNCSITRCAQPLTGVRNNRSIQDERLVQAIFDTSSHNGVVGRTAQQPTSLSTEPSLDSSQGDPVSFPSSASSSLNKLSKSASAEALEDTLVSEIEDGVLEAPTNSWESSPQTSLIFNERPQNLIVDARPAVNAMAMQAIGLGSENMENYPFASRKYMGIDNIHVMRESLTKIIDALKDSDITPLSPNRDLLVRSQWLRYISLLLDGADLIARTVGLGHSHVLIHCSDGWDRTSQLAALSQLCLDPYFRTLEGFIVLIEKDWLSFGHQFRRRSGFLGNEKFFTIQNEGLSTAVPGSGTNNLQPGAKALESALLSAKGFFSPSSPRNNTSSSSAHPPSAPDSDSELAPNSHSTHSNNHKETSPIFHQFIDAVYQLLYQHPTAFEFNERFLRRLLFHLRSCQYGTFLYDNERERVEAKASERTRSVWDYFLVRKQEWLNPSYQPFVDDASEANAADRLVFPTGKVRWWTELFGRSDEEMNGPNTSMVGKPTAPERAAASITPKSATPATKQGEKMQEGGRLPSEDLPATRLTSASPRSSRDIVRAVQDMGLGTAREGSGSKAGEGVEMH